MVGVFVREDRSVVLFVQLVLVAAPVVLASVEAAPTVLAADPVILVSV